MTHRTVVPAGTRQRFLEAAPHMTGKSSGVQFLLSCDAAGIPPTKRQVSKWFAGRGEARAARRYTMARMHRVEKEVGSDELSKMTASEINEKYEAILKEEQRLFDLLTMPDAPATTEK